MISSISFYIFSLFLSYIDCTRYKIPNILLLTLLVFLVFFKYFENNLFLHSFVISFVILLFFVIILLVFPHIILGGGDIKYIMVVAIYLHPFLFPLFLIITGILQMSFLLYFKHIKKRRVAPMAPAIFSAVIITEFLYAYGWYTFN